MKHFKKFSQVADYEQFVGGGDYVEPNICVIESTSTPPQIYIHKEIKEDTFNFPITLVRGTTTQDAANLYEYMVKKYNLGNDVVNYCKLDDDEKIFLVWDNGGNVESSTYFAWNINGIGGRFASTQNQLAFLRFGNNYNNMNNNGLAINSNGSIEWFSYEID